MSYGLTRAELDSLKEVARGGLMQKRIPDADAEKLKQLGLIEQKLGGLAATATGIIESRRSA